MKNSDEAIDRVLAGLRGVEAPEGMERRVLAGLDARAAAPSGLAWRGWAFGFAAAVAVVAGAMILAGTPRVQQPGGAVVRVPVVAPVGAPAAPEALVAKRNTRVLRYAQKDAISLTGRQEDSADVEPVASGGIPAPPMPLTEQEKLLLHLARRSDPQELTPLIAEVRAKQEAEFDEEFQQFFAPPEPVAGGKKTDPTNEDKGESR